jgi:DNA invertase Pin-like site-specific DNA recombinase
MILVIYARVSSQEQVSGYSLDAQVDLCRKWASEHGHEVSKTFIEFGKSARTEFEGIRL